MCAQSESRAAQARSTQVVLEECLAYTSRAEINRRVLDVQRDEGRWWRNQPQQQRVGVGMEVTRHEAGARREAPEAEVCGMRVQLGLTSS